MTADPIAIDRECARLCAAIYRSATNNDPAPEPWDAFDIGADDGVCWAIRRYPDHDKVVFRGSDNFGDWLRDFLAVAVVPVGHWQFGLIHPGFFMGLEHAWSEIRKLLRNPPVFTGHSLGAGRADQMCGLAKTDKIMPMRRVLFGEPKPGMRRFADYIADISGASYVNGDDASHDKVTDLAPSIPPVEYIHPSPLVRVTAAPPPANHPLWLETIWPALGMFEYHHAPLYEKALAAALAPA